MTSDGECFVYIVLSGETEFVTAGLIAFLYDGIFFETRVEEGENGKGDSASVSRSSPLR